MAISMTLQVVGVHYFAPIDKIPLVEVMPHKGVSAETLEAAVALGQKQGKYVVVTKDSPGFFTTRCLGTGIAEVIFSNSIFCKFFRCSDSFKKM